MKTLALILLIGLTGCAADSKPGTSNIQHSTVNVEPAKLSAPFPPSPLRVQGLMSQAQSRSVLPPPASVAPLWFHFDFTVTAVESSTDLVHWVPRADITLMTNLTDTETNVFWNLPRDPAKSQEFYRAGGTNQS